MEIPDSVNSGWAKLVASGGFPVRLARLDGLDLPDPDFVKIDAEGHEFRILKGAAALLRRSRPHLILENWLERRDMAATLAPLRFLESEGYRLFMPCWQAASAGETIIWPEPHPPTADPEQVFVLVPVSAEQRLFMAEHLSVYACPVERMAELERVFETVR